MNLLKEKIEKNLLNDAKKLFYSYPSRLSSAFEYPEILREYGEFLRENTSPIRLSKDNKNKPMWAHYSDDHKGICIKYDFRKCPNFLRQHCFPVWYDNDSLLDNFKMKKMKKIHQKLSFKPFLKKSKDWRCKKGMEKILDKKTLKKGIPKSFLHL